MSIQNKAQVIEYIQALDCFVDYLKTQTESVPDMSRLRSMIEHLCEMSVGVGENEPAVTLYNRAERLKDVNFYFPTAGYSKKESYKGNVLVISHELGRSGAPVVLADAIYALMAEGYFVFVISPMDGPFRADLCKNGVPILIDKAMMNGRCEPDLVRSVNKEMHWTTDLFVRSFDLVICNTAVLHNAVERYMHYDKPMIWWMHEGNASFSSFGSYLPKELPKHVRVAYVCDYVRRQLKAETGIEYPGTVLHYGIEDFSKNVGMENSSDNVSDADFQLAEEKNADSPVTFVTVGAIDPRKGQDLLLDAILRMPISYLKKSRFIIVGHPIDKTMFDRIEVYAEGMEQIVLHRSMPREDLLKLYEECDCIICSSRDDPLPVVLTEMMILKKTSICSDHTGTADILTDGKDTFLFANEDVDALCATICKAIDEKEQLPAMGQRAYELYKKELTPDKFRVDLLQLVGECFGTR